MSEPSEVDQIKAQVEQSRADLADTVDELAERLNVKSQAKAKADDLRTAAAAKAAKLKQSVPAPVQHAIDTVGGKATPVARRTADAVRPHRSKILAGAAAAAVALLILRRRRDDANAGDRDRRA